SAALVNAQHELAFRKRRVRHEGRDRDRDRLALAWREEVFCLRGGGAAPPLAGLSFWAFAPFAQLASLLPALGSLPQPLLPPMGWSLRQCRHGGRADRGVGVGVRRAVPFIRPKRDGRHRLLLRPRVPPTLEHGLR